jgi:hypothetical protein
MIFSNQVIEKSLATVASAEFYAPDGLVHLESMVASFQQESSREPGWSVSPDREFPLRPALLKLVAPAEDAHLYAVRMIGASARERGQ